MAILTPEELSQRRDDRLNFTSKLSGIAIICLVLGIVCVQLAIAFPPEPPTYDGGMVTQKYSEEFSHRYYIQFDNATWYEVGFVDYQNHGIGEGWVWEHETHNVDVFAEDVLPSEVDSRGEGTILYIIAVPALCLLCFFVWVMIRGR
jgi:hypothetical protein